MLLLPTDLQDWTRARSRRARRGWWVSWWGHPARGRSAQRDPDRRVTGA
jgi:hypothetical protein